MFSQTEMLDLVLVDGHAKGIIARNLYTGEINAFAGDAVVLATRRLRQCFFSFDQRTRLQRHRYLSRL